MDKLQLLKKVKSLTLYTGTYGRRKCTCSCIGCTQESYGRKHKEYQGNLEQIQKIIEKLPNLEEAYILGNPDVSVDTEFCNLAAKEFIKHGKKVMFSTSGYNGVNGIKEVTYKVKYQNDVEIEKKEISSKIIKKPVNKIVEVRNKQVTSRGGTTTRYGGKWTYSEAELDLLCAITAQEACSSYNAALAVITCAANRAESRRWRYNGTDPLSQYKARGQFCYSIDNHWRRRLNGNYPSYVKQAVIDALNGKRNHNYLSFRSSGYASGVNIGGNVYFNAM